MSGDSSTSFNPRVIGALIGAGIVGFIGYWLLSAFAPDLDAGRDGGTHALSRSATGFSGLYELARDAGLEPELLRKTTEQGAFSGRDDIGLLVVTPPLGTDPQKLVDRISGFDGIVLVILPKHMVAPDPEHRGWVRSLGRAPQADDILPMQAWGIDPNLRSSGIARGKAVDITVDDSVTVRTPAPEQFVLLDGTGFYDAAPVESGTVLASPDRFEHVYILSDPDLMNNRALKTGASATAALRLLLALATPDSVVAFDVTLNGLGSADRSLLRLAFTPPFLGLTLCFLAAALLALWQGFVRFGPPWIEERKVALGKAALVANTALLIAQARRVPHFAARYVGMVRETAAQRLHAPAGLAGDALDHWLDRFADSKGRRFSSLAATLERARNEQDVVSGAAALGQWRKEVLRDGQ